MISKKGFTLIELLAVIVVLAIILAIAIPGISGIIKNATKSSFASDAKMVLKAIDYKKLEDESFNPIVVTKDNIQTLLGLNNENYSQVNLSLVSGKIRVVIVGTGKWNGLTAYGTFKDIRVVNSEDYDEVPPVITILGSNPISVKMNNVYVDAGATANDLKDGVIEVGTPVIRDASDQVVESVDTSVIGATFTITYTAADSNFNTTTAVREIEIIEGDYSISKGVNKPLLTTGMTPIKWDGSAWINTTVGDTEWYNYTTVDKKWANAKTADGSMWVWVPRYVYKFTSGWHSSTAGTIEVQFSMATDDTRGGTVTLDTGTTANASNNKWTNHPAFTFGTTELTGIWVAKFKATANEGLANTDAGDNVTTKTVKILPNVLSWRNIQVSNAFTVSRNMETNSVYGWGTSGTDIDTHLMKNVERGAAVYLSKSSYGKATEIWRNNSNNFATGCAGSNALDTDSAGCEYAYTTTNGFQASTTGNIYGIYDTAGISEMVSAYMNNGNAAFITNSSSLINAAAKYKDIYTVTTDTQTDNYANAINKKGDAVYETSSTGINNTAWFSNYSSMPYTTSPLFIRGDKGAYFFQFRGATSANFVSFRPVLLVGEGL